MLAGGWKRQSLLGTGGAWLPGAWLPVTPHPSAGSVMAARASLPPCAVAESLHTPVVGEAHGLPEPWAETRSGARLGEAALLSWPPLE